MINFLQKYEDLKKSIPIAAVRKFGSEDCDYCDYTHHSKECYGCNLVIGSQNVLYATNSNGKFLADCDNCIFSELCYECLESNRCFDSIYLFNCNLCRTCSFCYECVSCNNCFGCVNLTHKDYCLWNKQLTKEEYETQIALLKKENPVVLLEKFNKLLKQSPVPANHQYMNENCPYGDYINNCKNIYWGFNSYYCEDGGYLYLTGTAVDCWDISLCGPGTTDITVKGVQHCYEISGGSDLYHCAFSVYTNKSTDCYYCNDCSNCTDCFGCVSIFNKQYCILNNQFTKEKYFELVGQIKKELGWKNA